MLKLTFSNIHTVTHHLQQTLKFVYINLLHGSSLSHTHSHLHMYPTEVHMTRMWWSFRT